MSQDIQGTINYYRDLLLYQYINQPNAQATIQTLAGAAICDLVALDVSQGFDIETAVGPQLDMIGDVVGRSRMVNILNIGRYFRWQGYGDTNGFCHDGITPTRGFTDYTIPTQNIQNQMFWYEYLGGSPIALSDPEYRFFIKLQIGLNSIDNTPPSISAYLQNFFEGQIVLQDNLNMSITYLLGPQLSPWGADAVSANMLPRPAGVSVSIASM